MKTSPQLAGQLPKGCDLDSLLTVEQFATWRQISPLTAQRKISNTPGVIIESREDIRIHPRTYLDARIKGKARK
jgi:hypothetical protein